MEAAKLEKRIREWAIKLGFTLPNGSAPPQNYFFPLTVTPHRRELWNILVDSIQSRKEIEEKRKQILACQLKEKTIGTKKKMKVEGKENLIELKEKQNSLESQLKAKKDEVERIESNIFMKASDVMFEICKLSDLEKQCEELKEKTLVLRLFEQKQKDLIEELKQFLEKFLGTSRQKELVNQHKRKSLEEELDIKNLPEDCKISQNCDNCPTLDKIRQLHESGITEQELWDEVIKQKKSILYKFLIFLEELMEKMLSENEKKSELENNITKSVKNLKQQIVEKALQVIVSETKRRALNKEVEKVQGKVERMIVFGDNEERSFNESCSFYTPVELDELSSSKKELVTIFRNHLNHIELTSCFKLIQEECAKVQDKLKKKKEESKDTDLEAEHEKVLESIEVVRDEIKALTKLRTEESQLIIQRNQNLQIMAKDAEVEIKRENFEAELEQTVKNLGNLTRKHLDLFGETPLSAFRIVETPTGEKVFESESLPHSLNNLTAELKEFFTTMLIPPHQKTETILQEVEKRKNFVAEIKKIIAERENLSESFRTTNSQLAAIKRTSEVWEKNYKDSDDILWSISMRANEVERKIAFARKILKTWMDQPYNSLMEKKAKMEEKKTKN